MRINQTHDRRAGAQPRWTTAIACLAIVACCGAAANDVTEFWQARDDTSEACIDHGAWQALLDGYLRSDHPSGINRFDYAALKAHTEDTAHLADYLASLQAIDPRTCSGAQQLAYWINFYNALTVHVVLADYPIESIRDIGDSWVLPGPWKDVNATVAEQELTLDNIEHDILRPIWRDNRIHYAVNCASYGCPNLLPQAFTAANAKQLFEQGAKAYVNHPRGASFTADSDLQVSSIYDWFQEDFDDSEAGVLRHLMQYATGELAERLQGFDGDMTFEYDWKLNAP